MTLQQKLRSFQKDWFSIYQSDYLNARTNTDAVAEWILSQFGEITLNTAGLREKNFCVCEHRGQARLKTNVSQVTEKRLVRAMYNARKVAPLGTIRDYEIPLKATRGAKHGDLDLIAYRPSELMIIEAKAPQSRETILKAILQAYTYTMLIVAKDKIKTQFLKEFGVVKPGKSVKLVPVVITFESAVSGDQLGSLGRKYPETVRLIKRLNDQLSRNGVGNLEFYLDDDEDKEAYRLRAEPFDLKSELILFDGCIPVFNQVQIP